MEGKFATVCLLLPKMFASIHTYMQSLDLKLHWNQLPDSHPHVDRGICKR